MFRTLTGEFKPRALICRFFPHWWRGSVRYHWCCRNCGAWTALPVWGNPPAPPRNPHSAPPEGGMC